MKKNKTSPTNLHLLRQKAEDLLKNGPAKSISQLSEAEILSLIHELEVHQVELEMQNDELRSAVSTAKDATDLYDFAPTGYFTLSRDGEIKMLNLSGAAMLGKDRLHLMNTRFGFFVTDDTKPVFNQFFERVFSNKTKETCEISLENKHSQIQYVQLTGIASENEAQCLVAMADISDRKRDENELLQQRWRLESIIEGTNLGTWEWNVQSGETVFNEQWAQIIGYTLQELKPLNIHVWEKYTHPDDLKQSGRLLERHFAGELPYYDFECRMKHKNGHWVWVHDRGQVNTWTNDAEPLMMFGTHTDITERKQAEEKLRESEHRYRQLVETANEAILVAQGDKFRFVNPMVCKLTGYTEQELLSTPFIEFICPDDRALVADNYMKRLKGEIFSQNYNFRFIAKGNNLKWVEMTGVKIDWDGQPATLNFVSDITARKQAEEALIESERHANALIGAIPDLMFIINRQGIYIDYRADTKDLSYPSESIIGKRNRDIMPTDFADLIEEKIKLTLQKGTMQIFEYQLEIPSRGIVEYEARMVPYGIDEVAAIVRDVTDRKKAEDEINRKNEDLTKVNAEKDKFFSIIAHDLRGPFNGFLELTELMAEESSTMSMDHVRKIATVMKKSATNLFRLLGNLLEWSRLQRGITQFDPSPIELNAKIHDIIALAEEAAAKKGIDINILIPSDLVVSADENMLEGILRNLVSNAVKYSNKGGCITVSATYIPDDSVEFAIKDTGIGMNKNILDNLFNIDVNTNRIGTVGELSTGLGLIICKDFIEKHNGTLRIESEPGKGSTFYFTLPGQIETENIAVDARSGPANEPSNQSRKLNILIAEDEETSDLLISITLTKISNEFFHAKTGIEAVDICRQHPEIDLIMMDIQMPEMDGYEATRQIRQFNKDVIIIAQTAYTYSNVREMSMEAGFTEYMSKPISQSELMKLIRKHIK